MTIKQERINLTSHDLELLDRYNKFLLKHKYTDADIELEEPTAINEFIKEQNELQNNN